MCLASSNAVTILRQERTRCLDIDQAMEDYLNPDQPIAWLALILFPDRDVISAFLAGSKNS